MGDLIPQRCIVCGKERTRSVGVCSLPNVGHRWYPRTPDEVRERAANQWEEILRVYEENRR